MPKCSIFTQCSHLENSSRPSHCEAIYRSMAANLGGNLSTDEETRMRAFCYAQAKAHARSRLLLFHAGLQINPHKLVEMLPLREDEFGVIPGQNDGTDERRDAVAARMLLPTGASYNAVKVALETLLGDDFVKYRPTTTSEAVVSPPNAGDQPIHFADPTATIPKIVRLLQPVTTLGVPVTLLYEPIDTGVPFQTVPGGLNVPNTELLEGEDLVIGAGLIGLDERVTLTDVVIGGSGTRTLTATFTKAHPTGTLCTTGNYPAWVSSKRHNLVVVTSSAAADPEKRRKINEQLGRQLRGVSTWDITEESSPGFTGPFTVDGGKIGITTIGTVTL